MKKPFGMLPDGSQAHLYTIKNNCLTAALTDFGATLVQLWVPDKDGNMADVVLGYDCVENYIQDTNAMGGTVGRNANRIAGASFALGAKTYDLIANDGENSLHSLPHGYHKRMWRVTEHREDSITFSIHSPHLDQGFPGNASVQVTYAIEAPATVVISYHAISDKDTIMNLTNHSFFNLAGHDKPEMAMQQELILSARTFAPADEKNVPTGEDRFVEGTPMDFRIPKAIGKDIEADYECLLLQGGYDHTFEVFTEPCAILRDPLSGRTMAVQTDCPGLHFYAGSYLSGECGKGGNPYPRRSGICLEPHFYPDAIHKPHWKQPVLKAGETYRSQTKFIFR